MKKLKAGVFKFGVRDKWDGVHIEFSANVRGTISIEKDMTKDEILELIGQHLMSITLPENIRVRRTK